MSDSIRCRNQAVEVTEEKSEAMEVVRSLIAEVRLVTESGALQVELRGELAGILALCETRNSNARQGDLAGIAE